MSNDLQKYAERKMPLFNLIVSIWQHYLSLKNTIGIGFEKSVFTHTKGVCDLNASEKEIEEISNKVLELIAAGENQSFKQWYKKAKALNKEADDLLVLYQGNTFDLSVDSYNKALKVFIDNFGFCTILPYWILFGINQALEKGRSKEEFGEILQMFEELKTETRYPQLGQVVMSKFFSKAAGILSTTSELASCLHPDELRAVLAGEGSVSVAELEKRMQWCAISRSENPYDVTFLYDRGSYEIQSVTQANNGLNTLKGAVAFKGVVRGKAKIVNAISDMEKFEEGDVLISIQSSPSLMPALIKCSAIVTDEGGIMCHASVISRELKKPCIIGTKIATKTFKDGDIVEVDANNGVVRIIK